MVPPETVDSANGGNGCGKRCAVPGGGGSDLRTGDSIMSKKIYINPGHSDEDPGAVGYETERKLNVKTAEFMKAYL